MRLNCSDKYLLDYMRIKLIDKDKQDMDGSQAVKFNVSNLEDCLLPASNEGYILIIEGAMPYNTTDGQLQLDVLSN